jgi:hypothetical protein
MTQLARGLVRSDVPASPPRSSRQACHSSPAAPRTFSAATRWWEVGTFRFLSFLFPSTIVKKKKLDPSPSFSFPLFAGTELGREDGEGAREEGQTILGVIDGGAGG